MQFDKNSTGAGFYSAALDAVNKHIVDSGVTGNKELSTGITSLESLSASQRELVIGNVKATASNLGELVRKVRADLTKGSVASMESLSDVKLSDQNFKAAAIVLSALGSPSDYKKRTHAGDKYTGPSMEGMRAFYPNMNGLDFSESVVSQEAYDTTELAKHQDKSVVFNMYASRQDPAAELLFKTSVHTPDEAGVAVSINNIFVINDLRHSLTGTPADLKRKNLLRAFSDASILAPELTRIYPVYVASGGSANSTHFVDTALVAPTSVTAAGEVITTAPLKVGETHDLLGLSQTPGLLAAGVMDVTDALDARLGLSAVYVSFTITGSPNVTKVVKFDVSHQHRAGFYKSAEANEREMTLTFRGRSVLFTADTQYTDGTSATGAAGLVSGSHKIRIGLELTGTADTQTGTVRVDAAQVAVKAVYNDKNEPIAFNAGTGQTLVNGIGTMAIVGYDLEARRTNNNRRQRGILIDTNRYTELYKTFLGSPVSAVKPTNSENDALVTQALVATVYARNTNNAITTLINNAARMAAVAPMFGNPDEEPPVEGIGRLVVKPYYVGEELDVQANINSIKSHERHEDIKELLGGTLRRMAYDMYYESSYQPALEMISGGTAGKPHVAIVTDPVTQKYLYTSGDVRFLGEAFDFTVVSNLDTRLKGKIYMTFVRPEETGVDPLSYGNFIWIPELISQLDMVRNGQISKEIGVQPRSLHMVNLPILVELTVKNLKEAALEKTKAPSV